MITHPRPDDHTPTATPTPSPTKLESTQYDVEAFWTRRRGRPAPGDNLASRPWRNRDFRPWTAAGRRARVEGQGAIGEEVPRRC
jgi:hypothetical protein